MVRSPQTTTTHVPPLPLFQSFVPAPLNSIRGSFWNDNIINTTLMPYRASHGPVSLVNSGLRLPCLPRYGHAPFAGMLRYISLLCCCAIPVPYAKKVGLRSFLLHSCPYSARFVRIRYAPIPVFQPFPHHRPTITNLLLFHRFWNL